MEEEDMIIAKMLIVGNASVGKTSLIRRYVHDKFSARHETTIGVDFSLKVLQYQDKQINMQLWDIAGQERFTGLSRIYYKDAVAAFIVFDVTNRNSFESVEKWKSDIDSKICLPNGDPIPVILLANKGDLRRNEKHDHGVVSDAEIIRFARYHNFDDWFITSAKSSRNVKDALESVLPQICTISLLQMAPSRSRPPSISLHRESFDAVSSDKPQRKKGCC